MPIHPNVLLMCSLVLSCLFYSFIDAFPCHATESGVVKGRALLIGINKYQNLQSLRGPKNDIEAIRQLLSTRYGFAPGTIRVLLDQDATKQGILDALMRLQQETRSDDTIYVHFSGYGSLVEMYQDNSKEPVIRQTLVPYDGRAGTTPDLLLEDMQNSLDRITSKGAIVVTDTAYSVTTSRAGKVRTRAIPADTRTSLYTHTVANRNASTPPSTQVWLAAAGLQHAALEAPVEDKYYGLLSYALARSLASNKVSAATGEIFSGVERELRRVQAQLGLSSLSEPRLIASAERVNRPLFHRGNAGLHMSEEPRLAYVEVNPHGAEVMLLNSVWPGTLNGSSWAIYPPKETEFTPGQAIATAIVTEVEGKKAMAQIEPSNTPIESRSRAVLVAPPTVHRLPIRLQNMPPDREQNLKAALQQTITNVSFVGKEEFARYVVDEQGEMVFVAGADGMTTAAAIPMSDNQTLATRLTTLLSRSSTASALASLDNPSSKIQLNASVAGESTARRITLSSSEILNPDPNGTALPLVVRLYQLFGKDKFEQATYQALLKDDHKVLAGDLLAKSEVTLQPNSRELVKIDPVKDTLYIGIMALSREPHTEQWRQIIPVQEIATHSIDVAFARSGIVGVFKESMVAHPGVKLVANTSASRVRIKEKNEPRTADNSLQLAIQANCDCYITIVNVGAEGDINLLFPNDAQGPDFYPKGRVRSGETILIPDSLNEGNTARFHFDYLTPLGIDTIRVFASTDLETAEMIRGYAKNPAQNPGAKLEAEVSGSRAIAAALERLDELKSGLRSRAVKSGKIIPQESPSSGQNKAGGEAYSTQEGGSAINFGGRDWTATSIAVIVDPS